MLYGTYIDLFPTGETGEDWRRYKVTIVEFNFVVYAQGVRSKLLKDFHNRAPGCTIIIEECERIVRI